LVSVPRQPRGDIHSIAAGVVDRGRASFFPKAAILAAPTLDITFSTTMTRVIKNRRRDRSIPQTREVRPGTNIVDRDIPFQDLGGRLAGTGFYRTTTVTAARGCLGPKRDRDDDEPAASYCRKKFHVEIKSRGATPAKG